MKTGPIFTEETACQDCYRCLRNCPVKAIRVQDSKAEVQKELCVNCGRCLNECPAGAKKIRSDLGRVWQLLTLEKPVVVSLAPSWVAEFGIGGNLPGTLRDLGFSAVEETAAGAQLLSDACTVDPDLARGVSSACPVIVDYITRYEPGLIPLLSPLASPLEAHARSIKSRFDPGTSVVFIGPCVAKKLEADRTDSSVDIALSFRELEEWLGMEESAVAGQQHERPLENDAGHHCEDFFLEGGFLRALERSSGISDGIALSGLDTVLPSLTALRGQDRLNLPTIELLACSGGCHNGPGTSRGVSPLEKRLKAEDGFRKIRDLRKAGMAGPGTAVSANTQDSIPGLLWSYQPEGQNARPTVSDEAVRTFLGSLGRESAEHDPDCGSCGYGSCRDFAAAVLNGMAEEAMCVSVMRRRAQSQSDALMGSLPLGAVIVDSKLSIRDCNSRFLRLFTEVDFDPPEESLQGARGRNLSDYMEDVSPVKKVLAGGLESFTGNISSRGRVYRATVFPIGGEQLAGAVFQDITSPQVKRETVIRKAEEVIQKSLSSVQQIASLLGENAADTQLILDSLIGAFDE